MNKIVTQHYYKSHVKKMTLLLTTCIPVPCVTVLQYRPVHTEKTVKDYRLNQGFKTHTQTHTMNLKK